jgi:hypothetical protein
MATSSTTTTDKPWYEDDAAQNFLLNLGQRYLSSQSNSDVSGTNNAILEMLQSRSPTGMDFSAFQPLMSAIGSQDFTKSAAIKDSQGFIDQIFKEYENSSLPKIYSNPRQTGIYNDTSTQLLANDAYSSAVAKGQSQLVQNILSYAGAREKQLNPVLQLMTGMVSNSNALMGAQNQANTSLASLLGQQGTQQATYNDSNRQSNLSLAQGLYSMYQDYQKGQTNTDTTNTSEVNSNVDTGNQTVEYPSNYTPSWEDEYWA